MVSCLRDLQLSNVRLLVCAVAIPWLVSSQSNVQNFQEALKVFADDYLGVEAVQSYLDSDVQYSSIDLSGPTLIELISDSLAAKFRERIDAVERLRDAAENNWDSFSRTNPSQQCCRNIPGSEVDPGFQQKVDRDAMCTYGQGINQNPSKFPNNHLLDAMKENLRKAPSIKWQYLGTEEGVTAIYPAAQFCTSTYDPRFRPWYVEAATPEGKDVVVIVDVSGSMNDLHNGRKLIDIAKEAARTVVDTLNPNDSVGLVAFSTNANTPPGNRDTSTCYSTLLAKATPQNKHYLTSFIQGLSASGGTYYAKALRKSFQLFKNSENISGNATDRDQVILFLTDGKNTDTESEIHTAMREGNAALKNRVILLTFGLGDAPDASFLTQIAHQVSHNPTAGEITKGVFTPVTDPSQLRKALGSYYNFFSRSIQEYDIIFTVPYFDAFGLGMVMSACLPVFNSGTFKGVTCVDMTLSDLFSDVTYFNQGEHSYAFITDQQGRLLMHPLLPRPFTVEEDPIFVHMTTLETAKEAKGVLKSMQRGEVGQDYFSSNRVVSRGDSVHEGVNKYSIRSNYYWHHIEATALSVCVVIGDGDRQAQVVWNDPLPQNFLYHRTDLKPGREMCSYFGREAAKGESVVFFSGAAFTNPSDYFDSEETGATVDRYETYFTGSSSNNPGFNDEIRGTVAATAYFQDRLYSQSEKILNVSIYTYIGMKAGVHRIFPGVRHDKYYDHTQRPWYKRALAQRSGITISTPYEDASGAGTIITLSQAIYEASPSGKHAYDDVIVGVMGMDFTPTYFYHLLLDTFPQCDSTQSSSAGCFLVDDSGYLILHPDWLEDGEFRVDTNKVHITVKEPYIAKDLMDSGVLVGETCNNYEEILHQQYWRLSLDGSRDTETYSIYKVDKSNIFVVLLKTYNRPNTPHMCGTPSSRARLPMCTAFKVECPCYENADYQYCKDSYDLNDDSNPPCTPREITTTLSEVDSAERKRVSRLEACYTYDCTNKRDKRGCTSTVKCQWDNGRCKEAVYGGGGGEQGDGPDDGPGGGADIGIIVAVVVVIVVVIALIAIGVIAYKKRKASQSSQPARRYAADPEPSQPPPANSYGNPAFAPDSHPHYGQADVASAPPTTLMYPEQPPAYSVN